MRPRNPVETERPGVHTASRGNEGVASLLAVVAIAIVSLTVLMALAVVETSARQISGQLRYQGHALNTASSGLTDALSWFQGQPSQPVASFAPRRDLAATPPVNETENPAVGIVRTFPLSPFGNVWGRYEVRGSEAIDASAQRGKVGTGTIWQLDARGIVFIDRNGNSTLDFSDVNGNGVFDWGEPGEAVANRRLRAEIQRLALVLPGGNAALQGAECSTVNLASGGSSNRVLGSSGGTAIACKSGTGSPTTGTASVSGNPAIQSNVSPYDDSVPAVFGMTQNELVGLASVRASSVADLPVPLPAMSMIVVQGNTTFTTARPLVGSGILVVFGDLAVPSGSAFDGVLYVRGSYSQSGPSRVNGAVVAHGAITLSGASDITEAAWDETIVHEVRSALGAYRFSRTQYLVQ